MKKSILKVKKKIENKKYTLVHFRNAKNNSGFFFFFNKKLKYFF